MTAGSFTQKDPRSPAHPGPGPGFGIVSGPGSGPGPGSCSGSCPGSGPGSAHFNDLLNVMNLVNLLLALHFSEKVFAVAQHSANGYANDACMLRANFSCAGRHEAPRK